MRILFNGDSVTDACRNSDPDFHLGYGYPLFVKAMLDELYPNSDIEVLNRGISGDVISGLESRFKQDVLDLKPDILSILIGINDTGFNEEKDSFGTVEEFVRFERTYRHLLDQSTNNGIENIILMEPFVVPSNVNRDHWRKDLNPKIDIVRKLAKEYNTGLVCLDGYFNQCVVNEDWKRYSRDGVHPSPLGNKKIAELWVTAAKSKINKFI